MITTLEGWEGPVAVIWDLARSGEIIVEMSKGAVKRASVRLRGTVGRVRHEFLDIR